MRLNHNLHLAYSTNVHRGETWREIFDSLKNYTLAVREKVCPHAPFGIGLRLSNRAAVELSDRDVFLEFQRWLGKNNCYVFTMNGFPYGQFHGERVKENVYRPDWTSPERLAYTNLLFNLLAQLVPEGIEGSVSTLPGSFKEFNLHADALKMIRQNLWHCVEHVARVSEQTGRKLHLGLEPEPLCLLENSAETIHFFDRMRAEHKNDPRLEEFLGVNYDTCHFAVEFEEPQNALPCLLDHGIKISKIHLSSALQIQPTPEALNELKKFADDVYFHQVVVRDENGNRSIYRDLPDALASQGRDAALRRPVGAARQPYLAEEWRIHFHVPLHAPAIPPFQNTNGHLLGVLDLLAENPQICSHLEMETYTWEVLPPELKSQSVVEQLAAEYDWTLAQLKVRGLA
ncbi:MAG TPA: metabolite traffic protein EboE [Methylomirabilota bacterium]|nr:metabolite traffic protein EboE [Methylomirabilota bacterium]